MVVLSFLFQCCGSGSGSLWPSRIRNILAGSDLDPEYVFRVRLRTRETGSVFFANLYFKVVHFVLGNIGTVHIFPEKLEKCLKCQAVPIS